MSLGGSIYDRPTGATPLAAVTAPTPTSELVTPGDTPADKTFGAFSDPDGRIASYDAAIVNAGGSVAIASGSGLGAYPVTGFVDGDGYTLTLTPKDSGGNALTVATHTVNIDVASYAPLVAGTAPAVQSVAAGGAPSGTTFNAPTGGSGSYSYAAVLQKPSGSSATLSGSGLTPWTISSYADGESYSIVHTATDTVTSETVTVSALVIIAAASAGAWVQLANLDYTGLDVQSPLSDAAVTVTKGSVQYGPAIAVDRVSSSIAVVSTGAAGVTIAGASNAGSLNFGANLSAYLDFAKLLYLPLRIDFICTALTAVDSATDGIQGGILTGSSYATASQERSTRLNYVSAGKVNAYASRQNTNTGIATNLNQPAGTFTLTTVLHANAMTSHWYTDGEPPADSVIEAGGTFALPANGSPVFPSALWGVVRGVYTGGFTLTGIIVSIFQ